MTAEHQEPTGSPGRPPRVFVTYSHDNDEHRDLVREFGTFLREEAGVDVRLDTWYDDGRRDWSLWAIDQFAKADFILVIASPAYRRRADGQESPSVGRGAQFEAAMVRSNLTRNLPEETRRVLPVVLPGRSIDEIPAFLNAHSTTHYIVKDFTLAGVEDLLYAFAGHPKFSLPALGVYRPPRPRATNRSTTGTAERETATAHERARLLTSILTPVCRSSDVRFGVANLDGTHYGDSVVIRPSLYTTDQKATVEYDLGRRFRSFEAVVGVLDDAVESGQTGYFQVLLDDVPQPQVVTTHGRPAVVTCDVSTVLRLRLIAYRPDTVHGPMIAGVFATGGRSVHLPELAWGDPKLVD